MCKLVFNIKKFKFIINIRSLMLQSIDFYKLVDIFLTKFRNFLNLCF